MASGSVLGGVSGFPLSASTTYYGALGVCTECFQATEANVQVPYYEAGSLDNLSCYVVVNSRTGASTLTVRKNGADTSLTITIPATTTGEFFDTSHTVTIAANDLLNYKMVVGAGGSGFIVNIFSCRYIATDTVTHCVVQENPSVLLDGTTLANTSVYSVIVGGGDSAFSASETETQFKSKAAFTAKNFWIKVGTNNIEFDGTAAFRINGANSTVITITHGVGSTTFTAAGPSTVNVDDLLSWAINLGSSTSTIEIIAFGFDLVSTTNNFYLVAGFTGGATVAANLTRWHSIIGECAVLTSESVIQQRVPQQCILSFLEIVVKSNTVTATSAFSLRKSGAGANGAVLIGSSATGIFIDTTSQQQLSYSDTIDGQLGTGATGTSLIFTLMGVLATITNSDAIPRRNRFYQQIFHQ